MKKNKKVYSTNLEDVILGMIAIIVIVCCYVLLNKNYMEGVNACIEKGNDVSYCEYHASK